MRTNKILACAAIAASLVACNKKNEAVKQDGNTYTSVQLRLAGDNLRAEPTENENLGTAQESAIKNISLVANQTYQWTGGTDFDQPNASSHVLKTKTAKKATAGDDLDMALVINAISECKTNDPNDIYEGAISNVTNDTDGFVMTSMKFRRTIKPNITKKIVENAANRGQEDQGKNFFYFGSVERVVAKGVVMKSRTATEEIVADGKKIGTVSNIMYAAVNGATKTYTLLDHAGERAMQRRKEYPHFNSAIHGVNQSTVYDNKEASKAKAVGLVRLSNYLPTGKKSNDDIVDYKAIEISENISDLAAKGSITGGKYFYENSADLKKEGNKSFYRLAHAKIYATFKPEKVWAKKNDAKIVFVKKAGTGMWYEEKTSGSGKIVDGATPVKQDKKDSSKSYLEGYVKYSEIIQIVPNDGETFCLGVKDQQFYADRIAAASSKATFAAGQKAHRYKNGKMAWRALWNRRMEGAKIVNGDARRNNIYVLTINSFTGIGMNYDPSDPNDPNLPDPNDNPDDPNNPDNPNNDDPHVENQDTYIAVSARVEPWNVVSRDVNLGSGNDNI